MKKLLFLNCLPVSLLIITSAVSCKSTPEPQPEPQLYVVNMPGENLMSLSKVTEGEYRHDQPYGGDNSRNLFFVTHIPGSNATNIYKKEDPFSVSMMQMTSGSNQNMAPAFNSRSGLLVFASRIGSASLKDLYMVNSSQGSALIQVTNTPDADENYPILSQDGKKVVYEKRGQNRNLSETEIWVKNLQTNENTMLGVGRMPSFSPDGQTIVYIKYAPDGWNTYLCTMTVDGKNSMQLTDPGTGVVWHPRFSPDGKQIIFQFSKNQKRDFDLYVVNKNGNNLAQLTINTSYDGEPYWANDGYVYFASDRGGRDGHYQIWRFRYGSSKIIDVSIISDDDNKDDPGKRIYKGIYHTVQDGETITDIARRYGITVRDVVKWNNLTTMTIATGMKLKVSAP